METTDGAPVKRSLVPLFFLVLVFALPPLLGWVFYLNPDWLPSGRLNHGTLIEPVQAIDSLVLSTDGGQMLNWSGLRDQWILTVVNRGECGGPCLARLIQIRQLRRALAADRKRVTRLLILLPGESGQVPSSPPLDGLEGTIVASAAPGDVTDVASTFELDQVRPEDYSFLIDPRGSLMMRHNMASITPKAILEDLQMLLEASANWVTGE